MRWSAVLSAVVFFPVCALAQITEEMRDAYQWFSKLGFSDVTKAECVEVWTGGPAYFQDGPATKIGFILSESKRDFRVLGVDLTDVTFEKTATPKTQVRYEKRDFREFSEQVLDLLIHPPANAQVVRFGACLNYKAEVFFVSYVAAQKGLPDLAVKLYLEATKLPNSSVWDGRLQRTMREELEVELAEAALWDAMLRFDGHALGSEDRADDAHLESRSLLLERFRRIERLYPVGPHIKVTTATIKVLEPMTAEDAKHKHLSAAEIAKLPVDQQVAEWIFQLRDQRGFQDGLPDTFDDRDAGTKDAKNVMTPALQLQKLGRVAVPQLLDALEDDRSTRFVVFWRRWTFSHRVLTVGDCAFQLLLSLLGPDFAAALPEGLSLERSTGKQRAEFVRSWLSNRNEAEALNKLKAPSAK